MLKALSDITWKSSEETNKDKDRREKMQNGYPITKEPFVPDILSHAVDFKIFKSPEGSHIIGFTLAPEGSELVEAASLEKIRETLLSWFPGNPHALRVLGNTLPRNIIAISYMSYNFQLGKSCQDFLPIDDFQIPLDAFFTYQKLSENLQATYYNENGTQFLAGMCYYPVPIGEDMYLANDDGLLYLCQMSAEEYPLQNRMLSYTTCNFKMHGRFCKTAGKRVLVDCSRIDGPPCHTEFDHFTEKLKYVECVECLENAITYKWEEPKNDKAILRILKLVETQQSEMSKLNWISEDIKIPMIHKNTKEKLPDSESPYIKDLVLFAVSNPDWTLDTTIFNKMISNGAESEERLDSNTTEDSEASNSSSSDSESVLEDHDEMEGTSSSDSFSSDDYDMLERGLYGIRQLPSLKRS